MLDNNHHTEPETTSDEGEALPVATQLVVLAVLLLILFGTGYMPKVLSHFKDNSSSQPASVPEVQQQEKVTEPIDRKDAFGGIAISAHSAFVWDVSQQRVLYEKKPDQQLPLASLTKLMTALVAHELITERGTVPISVSAILQDGESGLASGENFDLETLTDLTLMSSSNDGAFAIAAAAGALLNEDKPAQTFVEAMNIRASELGLTQTYFRNPTGLDISDTEAGAYGSARDVTFLFEHILKNKPQILEGTTQTSASLYNESGEYHQTKNTNQTVSNIPGIIGSKTGYTMLAGGNLAIAFDASLNRPIIVVVLSSTRNARFNDVIALSEAARNVMQ